MSHPVTIHSPGWIGYPGVKMWYFRMYQTQALPGGNFLLIEKEFGGNAHSEGVEK